MASIRVEVTAEHIAAAGTPPGKDAVDETVEHDPVELAIAQRTGQAVLCDADVDPVGEMATIGQGSNTLVANLPVEVHHWINAWYAGELAEPFAFDITLEDWLVALVAQAASIDDQAEAVMRQDPAFR